MADFLYHTSGLPFSTLARLENPMPGSAVAQQLRNENLLFAPGAKFSYASANYDVLGAVIENVTGKNLYRGHCGTTHAAAGHVGDCGS